MKKKRKKIITLLLGLVLILCNFGCSKDSKSSTETEDELVAPTNLIASVIDDEKIKLDWVDNCETEEGFIIERKNGRQEYEVIATVNENVTTYTDNNAGFNILYSYRVCAYLQSNQSNYSNEVSAEIMPHISLLNVPVDYSTIQEAIDIATEGDTVLVQSGTYIENINYLGKNITVASLFLTTQDASYISQTIINGNQNGSVVIFEDCENSTTSLIGFTITNGNAMALTDNCGGGIYCLDSKPTLNNLIIYNNNADSGGGIFVDGDMYISGEGPLFQNLTISNNETTGCGGGVQCYRSSTILDNVEISNNTADSHGGGINFYLTNGSFNNVIIIDNYSDQSGGGIYFRNSNTIINNTTISNNTSNSDGNGIVCRDSNPSFTNVEIFGNISNSDTGGGIYIKENSNPEFTNVKIFENKAGSGGGVFCTDNSNPIFINAIVSDNLAEVYGAGFTIAENSHPLLFNVVISENSIIGNGDGGGICFYNNSNINLRNCILWNNSPNQINFEGSGSSAFAYFCDIQGSWPGTGNINSNPLFINPGNSDFHLGDGSQCIDAGDPDPQYNDTDGTRNDMGAYGGPSGNW